jgi:hypothetical protein
MVSVDFFTVPTIRFQVLYVLVVLAHQRWRILHFGVTALSDDERAGRAVPVPGDKCAMSLYYQPAWCTISPIWVPSKIAG